MADTIEALKDKLQALEADSGGNKDRKKRRSPGALAAPRRSMKRGVVQYADLAIDLDGDCVPAHCFRAEALQAMAQRRPSAKAASKARRRAPRAWRRRSRPLRRARGAVHALARLERAGRTLTRSPTRGARQASGDAAERALPQKLENAVVDLSEDRPRKVAVTDG